MNEVFARQVFDVEFRYIDRLRGLNPSQRTLDDLDRQEAELIARVAPAVQRLAADVWAEGYWQGVDDARISEGLGGPYQPNRANPYRSAK